MSIPRLYETDGTPPERKVVYEHWFLPWRPGFFWLIAELDPEEMRAFGYACLNDPAMAEWGYIDLNELLFQVGAASDEHWEPCLFPEALRRAREKHGSTVSS